MKRSLRLRATVLALCIVGSAAAAPPKNEAETQFTKGVALTKAGDYPNALAAFKKAYEIAPNFRVLYNIAQLHAFSNDNASAIKVYRQYLAEGRDQIPTARRQEIEKEIGRLTANVAKVTVTSNVRDVEVSVDDTFVGMTPLAEPVLMNVGKHKISASKTGLTAQTKTVEVKAGEEHLVRWLNRRVGAPFAAPSLVEHGWKLMGGRLVPDGGQPAAQFMYEDGSGRRLTLYIRKETGTANTAFRFAEREGFGAFYWIDQPLAYALAGRLQREELMGLANLVYAQLEAVATSTQGAGQPPAPGSAPGPGASPAAPGR